MTLERRTPLKRGTKGLARTEFKRKAPTTTSSASKRRAPVRKVSTRRAEENKLRAKLRDLLTRRDGPLCAWPLGRPHRWDDMHEVYTRSRSGGIITDLRIIIGLCRHHNGVATDTRAAQCLGVVVPSWAGEQDTDGAMATAAAIREGLAAGGSTPCPWRDPTRPCPSPHGPQRDRCEQLQSPPG